MQPSPEIQAVTQQIFQAMSTNNPQAALAMCSGESGVVFIGSDPKEWFESLAAVQPMIQAMASTGSGAMPPDLVIRAMQEGTMGWSAYHYTGHLPNGSSLTIRGSNVYHQENGAWKVVHFHLSVAVPDEQVMAIAQAAG